MNTARKLKDLKVIISRMESALIAYSGGTDSSFLLKIAAEVLRDSVIAVTAVSETYTGRELNEARHFAGLIEVRHILLETGELEDENFTSNPPERCYYCKKELFSRLSGLACDLAVTTVCDGTNYDDSTDIRPGTRAAVEFGVRSPLKEAGLTKDEIRMLSKSMGLPTWNKPAQACLSSRFPYGTEITKDRLAVVRSAEECLAGFGFREFRVRYHNDIARIELGRDEMARMLNPELSASIISRLKEMGFIYITLDLQGYRTGSMNEVLAK